MTICVADALHSVLIDEPHGAKINYPVRFEAWPVTQERNSPEKRSVHFLWTFGDEEVTVIN